jgi:Na+-transporting NADH:ubiquinone oxidoreductase subunit NqrD
MNDIITYIKGGASAITDIGLALVSISILAEILFGTGALFGADVIGNITNIVSTIGGSNGLIGLVALFVLVALLKK